MESYLILLALLFNYVYLRSKPYVMCSGFQNARGCVANFNLKLHDLVQNKIFFISFPSTWIKDCHKMGFNKKPCIWNRLFSLLICTCFLKSQVWKIKFDELDFYCLYSLQKSSSKLTKNLVCQTWFFRLDFSKIKYRSTGGVSIKVRIFWEGHKFLWNLHRRFKYPM